MCIHTNTNTIHQWRCKSWSLRRDLVKPLFGWVRHRSWTWTESYSFEQYTSQTWCHSETSAVKAGATNVWDNAILPPTVSDDDSGTCSFNTDCVQWWHWYTLLYTTVAISSLFHGMSWKDSRISGGPSFKSLGSHGGVRWGPKKKISWCGVLTTLPDPEDLVICMFSGLMVNHDHTHNNSSYTYFYWLKRNVCLMVFVCPSNNVYVRGERVVKTCERWLVRVTSSITQKYVI
jgi:hypothetical protein